MAPQVRREEVINDAFAQDTLLADASTLPTQVVASARPRTTRRRKQVSTLASYIPPTLRDYLIPYHGDFFLSPLFHPALIAQIMAEGFLPIATEGFLLPKLHRQRCVIELPCYISKSIRKKARKFRFTLNQDFDGVVAGCHEQHGRSCWLYPQLVRAFSEMNRHVRQGIKRSVGDGSDTCFVRLHSVEVWSGNHLVAGELGYAVGSIYTSLTGFTNQNSAGSVQLTTLGCVLQQSGFTLWDMGMAMDYKRTLGSRLMDRDEFVAYVSTHRTRSCVLPEIPNDEPMEEDSLHRWNCRAIIDRSRS